MKFAVKNILYLLIIISSAITFFTCSKEVSVTPPDAPPPKGYIFIDSNPKGFQIYLEDKDMGRMTPDSLTWLSTGAYKITLKKNLFFDSTFIVNITEGQKPSVLIDFSQNTRMLGSIKCSSTPSGAQIFLNDSNTGQVTPTDLQNVLPGNYYVKFHIKNHRDDSIFVTVSSLKYNSAYKFLIDTTQWSDFTPSNSAIPSSMLTCIAIDKNNIIYAGSSDNGLFSFDGKSWRKYYTSLGTQVNCCTMDGNNTILFGTPAGFASYDGSILSIFGFKSSGLTDFRVQSISIDNNNNWFIGTQGGLTEYYQPKGKMQWITYSSDYVVSSTADINDNIWVGLSGKGAGVKDTLNNWNYYTTINSKLQSNNITAMAAGPTGEIWIGYGMDNNFGHGLTCFDGSSWSNYYPTPAYTKTNVIFIDKKNVKWVGTTEGLVKFTSPASPEVFNYNNTGLQINGVTGIAEDSYGNIWIATETGLYEYKGNH